MIVFNSRLSLLLTFCFVFLFSLLFVTPTHAEQQNGNLPHFPSCPNPGGSLVASYDSGWHWIVGNSVLQWGFDSVYHIGNNNFVQCFCPRNEDGKISDYTTGVQTNWLKVSNITATQKDALLSQGWILVEQGTDFGLPAGQYLAKNLTFTCNSLICNGIIVQSRSGSVNITVTTETNGSKETSENSLRSVDVKEGVNASGLQENVLSQKLKLKTKKLRR